VKEHHVEQGVDLRDKYLGWNVSNQFTSQEMKKLVHDK